jgi:ADP-heptose:LPS heptosyltransferase
VKRPLVIQGHHGLGDNLHQRAIVRQLMTDHDVWLETSWVAPYHDLIEQGLKVVRRPTSLRTQTKNAAREQGGFAKLHPPVHSNWMKLSYGAAQVRAAGSVLGAMFMSGGLEPQSLDFRLPVPRAWIKKARGFIGHPAKPILVYRPLVVRTEWRNEARNPDERAYASIFKAIRDRYHVVSLADLEASKEWIVGERIEADQRFHRGELDFEALAGLFSIASLVYASPGFAIVLAQAVSAPVIAIFGGYERAYSFSAGAQFSPWCPIEPVEPVDDFSHRCKTSKAIDMDAALAQVAGFLADQRVAA